MPTQISVLNRKTFIGGANINYSTEPMNLQGYRKAILGLTVHGISIEPVSVIQLSFQHASSPETNISSNWLTLTPVSGTGIAQTGAVQYIIEDFLPFVRINFQMISGGGSGNLRGCEVSLAGHAFEDKN